MSYNPADDFDYEPCINCDYEYQYKTIVEETAMAILKEHNANNGPDEQWLENEWYEFKDDAIERVVNKHSVRTFCLGCDHKYDLWDI
jgi:hypothetical protein